MICREFAKKVEESSLSELGQTGDAQLLAHERECAACAEWLQQRHVLAGALQSLRSSVAGAEAPLVVEQNVLRAFRQSVPSVPAAEPGPLSPLFAFRLSRVFEFGAYAAAAAALAVSLGLGVWYLEHRQKADSSSAEHKAAAQSSPADSQTEKIAQVPVQAQSPSASDSRRVAGPASARIEPSSGSVPVLAEAQQAQGYTPMMLCDPLSCTGEEQVVRMQLPATAADGSQDAQMADVIIGDDGLVRAIRIVQQ